LESVPAGEPLSLYGRGPNWLYAAFAARAVPADFWLFDVRLGWVKSLELRLGALQPDSPLIAKVTTHGSCVLLDFQTPAAYLDYEEASRYSIPEALSGLGVVLSGKLPHWLMCGLARAYSVAAWVAVYYPQMDCAIVVARRASDAPALGESISVTPTRT
jgi:CRISPR-associated protein Csx3